MSTSAGARWFQITIAAAFVVIAAIALVLARNHQGVRSPLDPMLARASRSAFVPAPPTPPTPPSRRAATAREDAPARIRTLTSPPSTLAPQSSSTSTPSRSGVGVGVASARALATPRTACALHVFRHVSKAGGTTVRFVFDKLVTIGEWEYPLPYGASERAWDEFVKVWRMEAQKFSRGERAAPRTLVEVRGHMPDNWSAANFLSRVLPDVEKLREEFASTCAITTSFLSRDPFAQYKSFYGYYIKKMQDRETEPSRLNEGGKAAYGANFAEWARNVPDMQTRELLHDKCVPQMREGGYEVALQNGEPTRVGVRWKDHRRGGDCDTIAISASDWARAVDALKRFDVVGTTERFNEFMVVVGRATGIKHLQYSLSNKGVSMENDESMRAEVIANITTYDEKLHAYCNEALTKTIIATYGSVDAFHREAYSPYVDATARHNGKTFVGGEPQPSPYKWVKASEAAAANVQSIQLPMWVMPNGGGQAWAYAGGDPVVMVRRADAPNLRCVKGCTFD